MDMFDKIMAEITRIHKEFPDMRFGMIIQNSVDAVKMCQNKNLSDLSSKEVLSALEEYTRHHNFLRTKKKDKFQKKIIKIKEENKKIDKEEESK